jgi:2,4-dienoyl-CoA reductase (NADPH2)
VPTIVTSVPNSAFVEISHAVAGHVNIPVVASNRINMPQAAEQNKAPS